MLEIFHYTFGRNLHKNWLTISRVAVSWKGVQNNMEDTMFFVET